MIGRRIWQKRIWTSAPRSLFPYTSQALSSPLPAAVTEHRQPPPGLSSLLAFCSYASSSSRLVNNLIDFGVEYRVNRHCFSSHALADHPVGGIVDVPLAQTGEGIAECELLKWYVQEGDEVEEFQPVCEVQSDKATIEITSRYKGKIAQIFYVPGDIVKVGETLLKMVVEDSQATSLMHGDIEETKSLGSKLDKSQIGGVLSTPAVRHLAKQHGINLNDVPGSGKDGRILKEDVLKYGIQKGIIKDSSGTMSSDSDSGNNSQGEKGSFSYASAGLGQPHDDKTVPLRGFQRTMVKTMSMAAKVPHFHYVEEVNCNALVELKASFQNNNTDPGIKHTFLPLLIKSLSIALSKYPWMNSCFNDESLEVILKGSHNIGIAMATPHGLVVPSIKNVQSLSILEVSFTTFHMISYEKLSVIPL
ncbi:lipoamide acyltransferase component of branched-chain alpha-keto acid dehydrogenase complex, mitochondrial isoform X2 [Jatropha curcas]|uniref:lipoamide acyltransferase component of branched-chain alpha-keto acid dehydrogenase complex, mitochondrial isoform X2 n=1 Tax=Jatropha curcas TaxID=180498 RepID=UPI001893F1BC|nr:lipoamide acyltransferase component of branched-chain alpha-keto acid dehydrogenase complex, mitochondrial isoform X2 [Jatropha curcas]